MPSRKQVVLTAVGSARGEEMKPQPENIRRSLERAGEMMRTVSTFMTLQAVRCYGYP